MLAALRLIEYQHVHLIQAVFTHWMPFMSMKQQHQSTASKGLPINYPSI